MEQYVWLQIPSSQSWKMILPSTKVNRTKSSIQSLMVGSKNQIIQTTTIATKSKFDPTKRQFIYPIRLIKSKNLYKVGPFVGILTTRSNQGFRGNIKNFIDIIQTGQKAGVFIFVFPAEDIDRINKTVKAYLYDSNLKKWATRSLPFPDVIYNRISNRKEEAKPIVQEVITYFRKEEIPFFNPYFFNKWSLYEWLSENKEFANYVPETTLLREKSLTSYLQRHPMLYLKPVNGKAGVGFIKIEKVDGEFLLTYQTHQLTYHQRNKTFQALWNKVRLLVGDKKYIIQQGIYLSTFHNQPYDIRVLVQKNGRNLWKVTGIGARVAGNQSITTHVPQGGTIQSIDQVLNETFSHKDLSNELKYKISNLAIQVAEYIEKKISYPLGELSMDWGIDTNNNLWFFEANSKPMEFDEPEIRQTSLLRLVQYFRYLSGFIPKGEE